MANNNQVMSVPFANVAGYVFNVNSLIAIDLTQYTDTDERGIITLYLLAGVTHTFEGRRADEMMDWYLEISGQKRVQRPNQPVEFPSRLQ